METFQDRFSPFSPASSSTSFVSNQHSLSFPDDCRHIANETIKKILSLLLPSVKSEQRREKVINHIRQLIKDHYGTEVLPFGSVPLRTYLPHGDIDLTTFALQNDEETTALGICTMLTNQNQEHAEFIVHDAQYVPAQVKIVKCIIQNIPVDISFNQVAGLNSLCFLEKVDEHIGRDHLFKCSIILIKAWCFYESRILGAQYGLISTYALEILVLYIINLFRFSLDSPLAVLYKFFEYYSTFDWEHHCISLNGPVYVKSLPRIVAVTPETSRSDFLLSEEFLENHVQYFSVRESAFNTGGGAFPIKHLNIIDPLKGNNNLGRSVRKANFCRIISALRYGCGKLKEVLMLPRKDISVELRKFFINTLERNEGVPRLDAGFPSTRYRSRRSEICNLKGNYGKRFMDLISGHWYYRCTGCNVIEPSYPILYFLSFLENHLPHVQTVSQTDILLMYNSVMGTDPIASFQGTSINRHAEEKLQSRRGAKYSVDTVFEKSKSRGTGTFIPYWTVEEKMASNTSIHDMSAQERLKLHASGTYGPDIIDIDGKSTSQGRGNQYFKMGKTNVYIPRLLAEDKAESQELHASISTSFKGKALLVEDEAESQESETIIKMSSKGKASRSGNETCSPDEHNSFRPVHIPKGAQDKHQGLSLQSYLNTEQLDPSSESNKHEKHSCFDLSSEDFPLLPSNVKAIPSENHKSVRAFTESRPVWKPLPCIKTESLTSAPSPASSILSSSVEIKESDDVVSTPEQCLPDVPIVRAEGTPHSLENNEEVLVQPYQLEDHKDFPPLHH